MVPIWTELSVQMFAQKVITETGKLTLVTYVTTNVRHVLEVIATLVLHVKPEPICMETNVSISAQMDTMLMLMELVKNVMVTVQPVTVPTPTIV